MAGKMPKITNMNIGLINLQLKRRRGRSIMARPSVLRVRRPRRAREAGPVVHDAVLALGDILDGERMLSSATACGAGSPRRAGRQLAVYACDRRQNSYVAGIS